MHFSKYVSTLNNSNLKNSVSKTAESVLDNIKKKFDYKSHISGLLLGNVQSGKTAQTFGVVSKLADEGFEIFLLLTTDNVYLQKQTLERANSTLTTFDILGEFDDVKFLNGKLTRPIAIVLKKNTNILRKWRNIISSSGYCNARPIVIVDDEADSASLNTLVNSNKISTINKHLGSIKDLSSSSIYIEVTATPQSILLQSSKSSWKPSFIYYFSPGLNYIGGDFVYSEPKSFCVKLTKENELDDVQNNSDFIPKGLQDSLMSFLVVCAHYISKKENTCNFLIHPSVRINDHEIFAERIGEHLNLLLLSGTDESFSSHFENELNNAWLDLQITKPDIAHFEDIKNNAISLLEEQKIKIIVLNSNSSVDIDYNKGFNIIVGGNSLGRGITIPKLQTVYYCRRSKSPNADTFWQHSRMFGYDREAGLLRVFSPPTLHKLFTDLNNSNKVLINQIEQFGISGIQLIYPNNIKPTRSNVIHKKYLNLIVGGVNFFPINPIQENTNAIDLLLKDYDEKTDFYNVNLSLIEELFKHIGSYDSDDWDNTKFYNCAKSLSVKRPSLSCKIIVRRARDISKGTGTLLSQTDRLLGNKLNDSLVLTLYRIIGSSSKGWNDKPFWIPNICFPNDLCFYDTIEL